MLRDRLGVSERWACRVTGEHRFTQRRAPVVAGDDEALRAALRAFAAQRKRWGYRRAHEHLIEQGWQINRKRVQRVWREEGLRVARRARRRLPVGDGPDGRTIAAAAEDDVWAIDFQADQTACGRPLRLINVLDEHTRQALTVAVGRSASPDEVVAELERLITARGRRPAVLADGQRPGADLARAQGLVPLQTGRPGVHRARLPVAEPVAESFHARVRDELLNGEQFACLAEVVSSSRTGARTTTPARTHSALGRRTPAAFAAAERQTAA
jgi:transposase InsO family protein